MRILAVKTHIQIKPEDIPRKINLDLGKKLVEQVALHYSQANAVTLNTRMTNPNAMGFYAHLGFTSQPGVTFDGDNPDYYVGYELALSPHKHL